MGQQLRLIFVAILTISVIHTSYAGLWSNRYHQVLSSNSIDREICQLRLYAVREFIETNDIIEKDVAKRKSKNDKSFETYGKHIEILLKKKWKNSKCQRLLIKAN